MFSGPQNFSFKQKQKWIRTDQGTESADAQTSDSLRVEVKVIETDKEPSRSERQPQDVISF